VFNTTACFRFTFSSGSVTEIELQNDPSLVLAGRSVKVTAFSGLREVVMRGLSGGNDDTTLSVSGTPLFRIPSGSANNFRGTIEIGYPVEYRNENPGRWDGGISDTLRFKWGSTAYLNAGDYSAGRPFIAPENVAAGQTFIWESEAVVSNGSSVELKPDGRVKVFGKITAIRPYSLAGDWTLSGGSVLTINIGSGYVFDVNGHRIEGFYGALPIAISNIKHLSGTIRGLNRPGGVHPDLTVTSERIYSWSGSPSPGGWVW
jgi:hypothetical protein